MIPDLNLIVGAPWKILPPGIHSASLADVLSVFGTNARRRELYRGLFAAAEALNRAGCSTLLIDGSFVSGKPMPGDYDALWDPLGVNRSLLDPVFLDLAHGTARQKAKYGGELFPLSPSFLSFFCTDRYTGNEKGIVKVDLTIEPSI